PWPRRPRATLFPYTTLFRSEPEEGFTEVRPGRYVRVLPADQVANFAYVRTTCTWQGEPFIVLGEADGWLRVEYTGGKAPVARTLDRKSTRLNSSHVKTSYAV